MKQRATNEKKSLSIAKQLKPPIPIRFSSKEELCTNEIYSANNFPFLTSPKIQGLKLKRNTLKSIPLNINCYSNSDKNASYFYQSPNIARLNNNDNLFENFDRFKHMITTQFKEFINPRRKSNFSSTVSFKPLPNRRNTNANNTLKYNDRKNKHYSFLTNNSKSDKNDFYFTTEDTQRFGSIKESQSNNQMLICDTQNSIETPIYADSKDGNNSDQSSNEEIKLEKSNRLIELPIATTADTKQNINDKNKKTNKLPLENLDKFISLKDKEERTEKKKSELNRDNTLNLQKKFPTYVINIAKAKEYNRNNSQSQSNAKIILNDETFINPDVDKDNDNPSNTLVSSANVNTANNIIITINNYDCDKISNYKEDIMNKESNSKFLDNSIEKQSNKLSFNGTRLPIRQLSKISEVSYTITKESDSSDITVEDKPKKEVKKVKISKRNVGSTESVKNNPFRKSQSLFKLFKPKDKKFSYHNNEDLTDTERYTDSEDVVNLTEKFVEKESIETDNEIFVDPNRKNLLLVGKQSNNCFSDFIDNTPKSNSTRNKLGYIKSHSVSRPLSSNFKLISEKDKKKSNTLNQLVEKETIPFEYRPDLDKTLYINKKKYLNQCSNFILNKIKSHMVNTFNFSKLEEIFDKIRMRKCFKFLVYRFNDNNQNTLFNKIISQRKTYRFDNRISLALSKKLIKTNFDLRKFIIDENCYVIDNEDKNDCSDRETNLIRNFSKKIPKRSLKRRKSLKMEKLLSQKLLNKKISMQSGKLFSQSTMRYPIQTSESKLKLDKIFENPDNRTKFFDLNMNNMAYCDKFLQLDLENDLMNFKSETAEFKFSNSMIKDSAGRNTDKDTSKLYNLTSRQTSLNVNSYKKLEKEFDVSNRMSGLNNLSKKTVNLRTMNQLNLKSSEGFYPKKSDINSNKKKGFNNLSVLKDKNFFEIRKKHSVLYHRNRKNENMNKIQKLFSIRKFQQDKESPESRQPFEKKHSKNYIDSEFLNKESMMNRTHEIKSKMLNELKKPFESLLFYMKDDNFTKFKEIIEKNKSLHEDKDSQGNTLLNLATQYNSPEISIFLIDIGADVNTHNNKLNTPLHYALSHKSFKMADILISRGAKEDARNSEYLTPWQCLTKAEMLL